VPLVLALEPDLRQAEALRPILERVGADLVLARSREDAVRALALRVPDLILVSALLSPRDEAEFTGYLRTVEDTAHLQTLSIPFLALASDPAPAKRRRFGIGRLISKGTPAKPTACAPDIFADEIRAYLARGVELKAQLEARGPRSPFVGARDLEVDQPVATAVEPRQQPVTAAPDAVAEEHRSPEASSNYWAWDSRPADASIPDPEPVADPPSP
jgi:CheY-like chemotaxis protein